MKTVARGTIELLPSSVRRFLNTLCLHLIRIAMTAAYHTYLFKMSNKQFDGLHLGSGSAKIKHFCNVDASPRALCDVVARIEKLKLRSHSVGTIYNSHVLEHVPRALARDVVAEWFRVLRPGGRLYVCVPDSEVLFKVYLDNLALYDTEEGRHLVDRACYIAYGGQANKYDFHCYGYSFVTLRDMLESVGFSSVKRFDRSELAVVPFRDISMVDIGGLPMSLNMEASK